MGQPSKPATRVMKSRFSHKKNRKDTNEKKWEPELREKKKALHKTRVEEKDKREKKEEWNVGNTLPLISDYTPHQQVALFKRLWRTWRNATFGDQRRPRAPPKHDKPLHILATCTSKARQTSSHIGPCNTCPKHSLFPVDFCPCFCFNINYGLSIANWLKWVKLNFIL
jgi:hypothetical protein